MSKPTLDAPSPMPSQKSPNKNEIVLDMLAGLMQAVHASPEELTPEEVAQGMKPSPIYTDAYKQLAYDLYQEAGSRIMGAAEDGSKDEDQWKVFADLLPRLQALGATHLPGK